MLYYGNCARFIFHFDIPFLKLETDKRLLNVIFMVGSRDGD